MIKLLSSGKTFSFLDLIFIFSLSLGKINIFFGLNFYFKTKPLYLLVKPFFLTKSLFLFG
jgi:hypothetical protein